MERKSPWCPACLDYKGEENELHTCIECGIRGFACCVPGPGQLCVNCYEEKKGARGTGIRVSELVRRVTFFRRQRAMLLGMADDYEREAVRVLALLRHQGVENPSQTHRWGCCNSEQTHCHEAPACCSPKCWCQREVQGGVEA